MTSFDEIMRRGRTRPPEPEPAAVLPEPPIWEWSRDDIDWHYQHEHCHHLAIALRRLTGLPLAIMWNPYDWHVRPDENGQGGVLELVHVYVATPDGNAIDILGERPLDEMRRSMAEHDWAECPCEELTDERLEMLVHESRNLRPYDEGDVADAMEIIRRSPMLADVVARLAAGASMPRP